MPSIIHRGYIKNCSKLSKLTLLIISQLTLKQCRIQEHHSTDKWHTEAVISAELKFRNLTFYLHIKFRNYTAKLYPCYPKSVSARFWKPFHCHSHFIARKSIFSAPVSQRRRDESVIARKCSEEVLHIGTGPSIHP